jgi:DNA-binding NarL/FixJ family response regulator
MRVVLVGSAADRARLRGLLTPGLFEIVGEAVTLAAARSAHVDAQGLLLSPAPTEDAVSLPESLTSREREVLNLLAEGLSNKAIARRLGISDQTVKFHVAAVCGKLGAMNRTDAVRRAIRRGLVAI